jgi:hypothetical protein
VSRLEPFVGQAYTPEAHEAIVDTLLERPGDYLVADWAGPAYTNPPRPARYPDPVPADLVVLSDRNNRPVLSVTSGGKVQDFYIKPSVVAHMARQAIDLLHSSAK